MLKCRPIDLLVEGFSTIANRSSAAHTDGIGFWRPMTPPIRTGVPDESETPVFGLSLRYGRRRELP